MNALGYALYVLIAVLGGLMALSGTPNLVLTGMDVMTLGAIASFLQLSRSFVQPISQVTQQISSIIMAMAGASRIFALLDEESELGRRLRDARQRGKARRYACRG